jgi:tyrosyl-tRNA synthetase
VTSLLHGETAATAAASTAREVFEHGGSGDNLPTLALTLKDIGEGISIVQLIVKSGLTKSGKEAKRLISEGGAKINDLPVPSTGQMIVTSDLDTPIKISAGKKRHVLVSLV